MKRLSKITEGILGDIIRRDIAGNNKKEDDNLESLFDYLNSHYNTANLKTNFKIIRSYDDYFINRTSMMKDCSLSYSYSLMIRYDNGLFAVYTTVFTGREPTVYKYFIDKYSAKVESISNHGVYSLCIDNVKSSKNTIKIIDDILDKFQDK